jgi:hypothetical protein
LFVGKRPTRLRAFGPELMITPPDHDRRGGATKTVDDLGDEAVRAVRYPRAEGVARLTAQLREVLAAAGTDQSDRSAALAVVRQFHGNAGNDGGAGKFVVDQGLRAWGLKAKKTVVALASADDLWGLVSAYRWDGAPAF